ncbi:DnaJ C-terminal domain-containing protein [Methyloceanibacter marginalis]|uniref:DnaJ C-terminal domain-containing protein n=1 Tax=Methyloceanibacter marginalis TaxID=1774971 RepID=UPI000AF6CFA0|nr:DnaJ C-terminal domain-containing protein [Methyloceanibacter marginalis]
MAEDLYSVLGVPKTASAGDITKAYRKLAKKLHPDLNPGDAVAEDKFKQISHAYSILKDPEQRGKYDRGEIDASGQERPQQQYYREYAGGPEGARYHSSAGFEDIGAFSDLFGDMFGGAAGMRGGRRSGGQFSMRGQDAQYHLDISFLDAVNGTKQRITLPDGGTLDVTIPAGVSEGQVLRLKGKGMPGLGEGPPGDALVEVGVKPHPVFRREGNDIVVDLPISFDEAVLGARSRCRRSAGAWRRPCRRGPTPGRRCGLRARGVKGKGDQLVKLTVMMPETVDDDLKSFAEEWRKTHAYDPRGKLKERA